MWLLDWNEHIHEFRVSSLMVLHRRLHDRSQRRVAIDPGRIVTIALKRRNNDWPPAGQLGDTAETCSISVPGFDFGSIELGARRHPNHECLWSRCSRRPAKRLSVSSLR
jgi:hypothetical protein